QKEFSMLNARVGGLFKPKWKIPSCVKNEILVRIHRDDPGLHQQLFNEPLHATRGELMRCDLVERGEARMDLIFTWAHTFMDATAAEHFLAAVSDEKIVLP